ncbi:MAG: alpha/beta hydrolase [Flavobacteriales bacterium]|nr:alpha/beta hydrolase [Flavobacteriales bacterium]
MAWVLSAIGAALLIYGGALAFYWILQERFIFLRYDPALRTRFRFGGRYEQCWLDRPDGARLHALWFKAREPRGVLLYFHGHSGNLKRWGRLGARFTALGHDVLMPDPRGYGKSSGRLSEQALIADAVAWHDWLSERVGSDRITLYGRSLGSALATPVAAQRNARMLLLETPFNNLIDVCWSQLPLFPYRLILRYPFRNEEAIRNARCPVRIFHGTRDQMVPLACALKLYAAVPGRIDREAMVIKGARHNDLWRFPQFRNAIRDCLR